MNDFIFVWVLMLVDPSHGALTYSPPVKTLEDCQRMARVLTRHYGMNLDNRLTCVEINILKKASEK